MEVLGIRIYAQSSVETALTMENMNEMMAIIITEMAEMQIAISSLQILLNGFVLVEMKWLLTSVMNGEEMELERKIPTYGTLEETSSVFKKLLAMKEILGVEKVETESEELKMDLFVEE